MEDLYNPGRLVTGIGQLLDPTAAGWSQGDLRADEEGIANYQKYDFHVSTGTPTGEIETILKQKSLRKFFNEVYGSPQKKDSHVKKILKKYSYNKNEVVFIGDALSDRNAARNNDISFIGRYTTVNEIKNEKLLINDFSEIDNILKKITTNERIWNKTKKII